MSWFLHYDISSIDMNAIARVTLSSCELISKSEYVFSILKLIHLFLGRLIFYETLTRYEKCIKY